MLRRTVYITYLFLVSGFMFSAEQSFSQNVFSSESDLKKRANKLFGEEDFVNAYPLFSQLLSLYPKDPQYNYKFGTCLLFSGKDKEKAIPYLEFAARRQKQNVDKEVFFYLGKAYHLNYRFADAMRYYNIYKNIASSKSAEKYDVNRQVEMCENGRKLLSNITDLSVLEKKEVPEADFFRSYNLSEFNAKLIVKPDDLKTSFDKKKKEESSPTGRISPMTDIMYIAPDRNQIYFSGYGEDGKNGKDIFYVTRTASGGLSAPVRLSDVINTKYDEDYPFLHPNGKILYFCSKGHNSMGGYDIFKSEWNENTQSWGKPVNMDFAINTPDDDILFISDSEDKTAYFSSRRENANGMLTVYKIALDRKPLDLAIIRGTLTKNVGDKIPDAKITVTKILQVSVPSPNVSTVESGKDETVGVFSTNPKDGSYSLNLPSAEGGKFMFSVESSGFKKSSELVVIPLQQEIKPLKQSIALVNENGQDKLIIKNEFNAQADSADIALAVQYIKEKASLEVNTTQEELSLSSNAGNTSAASNTTGINQEQVKPETTSVSPITNTEIIEIAYQDARETQKEANELRKNSESARQLANQKQESARQKYNEAQELIKNTGQITNQEEKIAQTDKAARLTKEAETLTKETNLSLSLSKKMEEQANKKQQQADAEMKYAKDFETVVKTGANEKKMNELLAQKEELEKKNEELNTSSTLSEDINKQSESKQNEANKAMAKYLDLKQDADDLQKEAKRLRTEADKTKNDAIKQNLNQQADEMVNEADKKNKEAAETGHLASLLQVQADSMKNNVSVMKEIKSSPETTTTASYLTSPYIDVFIKQIQDADKKEKELDKEEAKAVIYQSWTDSLDNQVAALKKAQSEKFASLPDADKSQIQNKIYELQSSADDKRQKAAESRSKVDNLKLQEALAAASNIPTIKTEAPTQTKAEEGNNETGKTEKVEIGKMIVKRKEENITGTKNINEYYGNKLKKNKTIANAFEKKAKEQEIYQNWSAALYDESLRLKKDGKGGKAESADKESKAKQILAIQSANEATEIKAEHPELVASANLSSEETTVSEINTPSSNSPAISPATTISSTNTTTTTAKNPASTQTVSASSGAAEKFSTETKTESSSQPNTTLLSSTPPASVKNKDEYTHFAALKNESEWIKSTADRQYKQADELQKLSDEQLSESQRLLERSNTVSAPGEKEKLVKESENLEKRSLINQTKADSVKTIAKNTAAEANARQTESELYLQSLDKTVYEEITSATGYKPATENLASNTTSSTSTVSVTEPSNTSATVPETTIVSNPEIQNNISAENPAVTETKNTQTITETNPSTKETAIALAKTEANTSQPVIPETGTVTVKPATTASAELLKYYDAIFDKLELTGSSYSSAKPIPVDPPMPEGLIFKVQIGAFRNPIPQDLFKGIKPIVAETTPLGFKRYTAGLFQKFQTAVNAKEQVNNLGYRDAFIVAFFNGKRISMNEALAKARESGEEINTAAVSSGSKQPTTIASSKAGTDISNTTDVKSVSGLFYAIQIGVFSKPVTSAQLYNISPLNSERTESGLIRYTTGRFDDETKAVRAKNSIAEKGISDAFVVAYRDGKRISLSAAKNIIATEGKDALTKTTQEYTFSAGVPAPLKDGIRPFGQTGLLKEDTRVSPKTTASETSAASSAALSKPGIIFKIQIGAFREDVPVAAANKFLSIAKQGIKTYKDEAGLKIYTTGEFSDYELAKNMKAQLVNNGLSGAFIIAFQNGKKINVQDALEMIKK